MALHNRGLNLYHVSSRKPEAIYICCCSLVLSRVRPFATLWTVVDQAPLSMRFSRQEDWSGLPCPPPGDLPDPGMEPVSPGLEMDSLLLSHWGSLFII